MALSVRFGQWRPGGKIGNGGGKEKEGKLGRAVERVESRE